MEVYHIFLLSAVIDLKSVLHSTKLIPHGRSQKIHTLLFATFVLFNYNVQDFLQMTGFFPIADSLPMPSCSLSACLEQMLICWYGKLNVVVMCLSTCKCGCGKATFT
jgi:hypothetical protein